MRLVRSVVSLARRALELERHAAAGARHDYEAVYRSLVSRLREVNGPDLGSLRVLDFGCGYRCPMVTLLQGDVREVVGLEIAPVFRDGWWRAVAADGGLREPGAMVETTLLYLGARRYYRHLRRRAPSTPSPDLFQIVKYDGRRLPFPDSRFDVVISNAVLQYIPEPLEDCARELARVLVPGGMLDLEWHNFYSWRGHHLPEAVSRKDPWGHLLGGVYDRSLNRVTPARVAEAFSTCFDQVELLPHDRSHRIRGQDPDYEPEAAEFLAPEIRARLSEYPVEWLTTRGYILRGRRKSDPSP